MNIFIVTSDKLSGLKRGDTVTDKDLEGVNVEALIDSGHLSTQSTKKSGKNKDTETDKD